jgi:hypothetical protein
MWRFAQAARDLGVCVVFRLWTMTVAAYRVFGQHPTVWMCKGALEM